MGPTAEYYKLDIGNLPDELFHPDVPVEKWLARATTAGKAGFPKGSLNVLSEIPWDVEVERLVGIALYMVGNVLPFTLPILLLSSLFFAYARHVLVFLLAYVTILWIIGVFFFQGWFLKKYKKAGSSTPPFMKGTIRENLYVYTGMCGNCCRTR
jgi:hypothetical protein